MLSRRRSSERTPDAQMSTDHETASSASSPEQSRILTALRGANLLFSVAAEPDNSSSSTATSLHTTEIEYPKRRLFRSSRRSTLETRAHVLVVCSMKGGGIRLQHVVDFGNRAVLQRGWPLSDLRKIDGLGEGVIHGLRFGLYFASGSKTVVWKCEGARERAVFLWALLQCCVSNLRRAPPVANLLLLDLQMVAEGGVVEDTKRGSDEGHVEDKRGRREDTFGDGIRGKVAQEISNGQKVTRTLSEPKASKVVAGVEPEKRAETVAPVGTDAVLRGLNMDERAFIVAAKRMGGGGEESYGSDPKARMFQNRLKIGDANTAKVVAERKWQQEKKLFRLSRREQEDLLFALELFREEKKAPLMDFGSWTEARIQSLEVENIADIVNVEKKVVPEKEGNGKWPYSGLVEAMTSAEPWLLKCQTLLAPFADLAEDLHSGVELLEIQMKNMRILDVILSRLLDTLTFEHTEQSLVDGIGNAETSSKLEEFDSEDFHQAVQIIASKVEALERLSPLSEMSAVKNARNLLSERHKQASVVLLPALKAYVDQLYPYLNDDVCDEFFEGLQKNRKIGGDREEQEKFLVAVKSIAIFGRDAFAELIDHYISLSSRWILDMLSSMKKKIRAASNDLLALVTRTEILVECLFFICVAEGAKAFYLFFNATDSAANGPELGFSRILRRQVSDRAIVSEFFSLEDIDDPSIIPCLYLHGHYFFDYFAERLANCVDLDIESLLAKTEEHFSEENSELVIDGPCEGCLSDTTPLSANSKDEVRTVFESGSSLRSEFSEQNRQQQLPKSKLCRSFDDKGYVRESVSTFFDVCRDISLSCHSTTEDLVGSTIALFAIPRDVNSESGRAEFFECVRKAITLCCDLSSSRLQVFRDEDSIQKTMETTKTLCEKLVGATMRSTEVVAHSCSEGISDIVKMQSYGYISVRLGEPDRPEMFVPLAHLSTRVRKHVMARWAERELYSSLLNKLKVDTTMRALDAQSSFMSSVQELSVSYVASFIDKKTRAALETAADTGILVPFYTDIVLLTKEKMENILRAAKKDKAAADARAKLLSFSRELIAALRHQLKDLQRAH